MSQHPPIDPWKLQRDLMKASGQRLPSAPTLTKEVVLYAALNLEEGAETLEGLTKALLRIAHYDHPQGDQLRRMATSLTAIHDAMKHSSKVVRSELHELPDDFTATLTDEEVIEMADGTTDLTVTNSGFALALGIDGAACYADVNGSNLSKADPATGKIAKTPDGKWIKHPDWQPPDLAKVIFGDRSNESR
jgi:predicted HAD superfamily Cof-like phosphohydrolase